MAISSWIRRQFKNGVTLTATTTMTNTSTSFSVPSGLGATFPDGSVGPFIVTVDQMMTAEEKILVASRSGDTFAVAVNGRGYNGTTAQAHTNATVYHTIDAQDLDEANQVANQTLGAITTPGDLLQGSGTNALTRLARGTQNSFLQAGASLLQWTGFGVGQSSTVAATASDGLQTTPARSDHVHAGLGQPLALTGATAATRYVGGTASGAPGSGTFATGDFVVDQTGTVWVCTAGGSPGTWTCLNVQPSCRVYRTTASTDANTVFTTCPFDTVQFDTASKFNVTTHLYTVPSTGIYLVSGAWAASASSAFMQMSIIKNGSGWSSGVIVPGNSHGVISAGHSDLVQCTATTDTLGMQYLDGGGNPIVTGATQNWMSIVKVSN